MKKRLILGVTVGGSSRLLDGQAKHFRELGYEVFLISQNHPKETLFCKREGITHLPVDIIKNINPAKDLKALIQIVRHFKKIKPDIINVGTPKMGLLGIIAAWLLGIKIRVYTCRGLPFVTERRLTRWILKTTERITIGLATKVIYVSTSLENSAKRHRTYKGSKSVVLGHGTSNGVDLAFYSQKNVNQAERNALLAEYGLQNKFTIGFVGRVSREKGVFELVEAFEEVNRIFPETRLIMMGHINCESIFEQRFRAIPGIIHIPFQDNVPLYMSLFDLLVLPSWREGFPNVPIQAAAMGIPVIVSSATGCIDSVNPDVNGKIFEKGNVEKLAEAMRYYIGNPAIIKLHGQAGIDWANKFRSELIWQNLNDLYNQPA